MGDRTAAWIGWAGMQSSPKASGRTQAGTGWRDITTHPKLLRAWQGVSRLCAGESYVKDELPRAGNSELRLRSRAGRPKSILYHVRASRTAQLLITQSCRLRLGIHGQPASEPS